MDGAGGDEERAFTYTTLSARIVFCIPPPAQSQYLLLGHRQAHTESPSSGFNTPRVLEEQKKVNLATSL